MGRERVGRERVGKELLRVQFGAVQVALGNADASQVQLSHDPGGKPALATVEDVGLRVGDWSANCGDGLAGDLGHLGRRERPPIKQHEVGRVAGTLGDSVPGQQSLKGGAGEQQWQQVGGEGFRPQPDDACPQGWPKFADQPGDERRRACQRGEPVVPGGSPQFGDWSADDQCSAGDQRRKHLHDAAIEVPGGGEGGTRKISRLKPSLGAMPEQVGEPAMRQLRPLGKTGGSRGVDHTERRIETRLGKSRGRLSRRRARLPHSLRDGQAANTGGLLQPGGGSGGQHEFDLRIPHQQGDSFGGRVAGQGDVMCARQQNSQDSQHARRRAVAPQPHAVPGDQPVGDQSPSQAFGLGGQFAVGPGLVSLHHRDPVGSAAGLFQHHLGEAHIVPVIAEGGVELAHLPLDLGRGHDANLTQPGVPGRRDQPLQDSDELPRKPFRQRVGDPSPVIADAETHGVVANDGEGQRQAGVLPEFESPGLPFLSQRPQFFLEIAGFERQQRFVERDLRGKSQGLADERQGGLFPGAEAEVIFPQRAQPV